MKPDGTEASVVTIEVTPPKITLAIGETQQVTAKAKLDDMTEMDVTSQVLWTSVDPAIASISPAGLVTAVAAGHAVVRATANDVSGEATVDVAEAPPPPPELQSIRIEGPMTLGPGESATLTVRGSWSDGATTDVTGEATFVSSAPSVITVDAMGRASAAGAGTSRITAQVGALTATLDLAVTCSYPEGAGTQIRENQTMPRVSWQGAYRSDGTRLDFALEDVACGAEYEDATVVIFVVGAGWCAPCTEYAGAMAQQAQAITAAGGLIVFVEAEDTSYNPASTEFAFQHVGDIIGNAPAILAGDADTQPMAEMFRNAPITNAFPTAFVVRKSDMKLIVNQSWSQGMLPYVQIARNPNADWSNPDAPPFSSNCGPNDEEASEPNDVAAQAAMIQPGTFQAGICAPGPDFYEIAIPGAWRLSLDFTHAVGDIDVYVWDTGTNDALRQNGQKVGSESADDDEQFEWQGPAIVRVNGYQNASAPYALTLEEM